MNPNVAKYAFELWTPSGILLADLSGIAMSRRIVQSRNEAEEISFDMNLDQFESYCRSISTKASEMLISGVTEVRVRRGQVYLCGGQVVYTLPSLDQDNHTIKVRATGFLNMFSKRRTGSITGLIAPNGSVQESFIQVSRAGMLWTLISQSQELEQGDFGITQGPQQYYGALYNKTYNRTVIKDAIQSATRVEAGPIDIEFTYDKKFNTYQNIGSERPDIVFEYPGNIRRVSSPDDATDITNEVIGIGQGLDIDAQTIFFGYDADSASDYKLRQDTLISNATDNSDNGLTDAVNVELASRKRSYRIPSLTVDGNIAPFVTDYGIGDRIACKVSGYSMFEHINGMYALERRTIEIDDNDNETVTLEVDAL